MGLSGMQSRLLTIKSQQTNTNQMMSLSSDKIKELEDKLSTEKKNGGDTSKVQAEWSKEQVNYKDLDAKANELDAQYEALLAQIESEEKKSSSFLG